MQFYEREDLLCDAVADFLAAGLAAGNPGLAIATPAHREGILRALAARGVDPGQELTLLDARETLALCSIDGKPDAGRFACHVGAALERCGNGSAVVHAYGEMVDLLWQDGDPRSAIRLEELWNDLARTRRFALLCAYAIASFDREDQSEGFDTVCRSHTHVVPAGTRATAGDPELLRETARLQQRARILESEIERRKQVEAELRSVMSDRQRAAEELRAAQEDLADFFENAPVALHWVGADGIILRVNKAELDLLGYRKEEYVGHHISEFHADERSCREILERLARGETLIDARAWLRHKDGSVRHVLVSSNVRWEDGKFVHTRCFTKDVTAHDRAEAERAVLAAENARLTEEAAKQRDDSFRLLVDSVTDYAIFLLDTKGHIASWNRGAQRLKGYEAGEIVGKHFSTFYPEEDVKAGKCELELEGAARVGRFEDEGWRIRKDGSRFWANVIITALRDEDGSLRGFGKVTRDLTQRKRVEEELRHSEERLRLLVEQVKDYAIFMLDPTGHVLTWNVGAERLKGYKAGEIIGKHFSLFYPEEKVKEGWAEEELRRAVSYGRYEDEGVRVRKDGSRFIANVVITALYDGSGALRGFAKVTRDVTERFTRAEGALRASEERFQHLAAMIPSIIWTATPDGRVTYANERWAQILGQAPHEGSPWSELHPDDRDASFKAWRRAIESATDFNVQARFLQRDGSYRWFATRATPMRDSQGAVTAWCGVATDVHDLKQLQGELEEADRRKDEFLAMLSHELRNPLAPLGTAVHLARSRSGEREDLKRPLEVIARQTQHLKKLVDDLLEVSRITRGKIRLEREPLDAATAVNRAVEISRPLIDSRGHHLTVALPHEPLWLDADLTRLAQVLGNLLNNAAKYTDEGGRIWIGVESEGRDVVFRVRDDGIGIPPELMPRLFEIFTQGETSLDRSQGGLGIGLTLVRGLVELHGGTVEARSDGPGKGSEFTVRLPALRGPGREPPRTGAFDRLKKAPPRRILVVDDNLDAAQILAELLEESGHVMRIEHDGPAALVAAREFAPHVILLDIGLPRMDGYEVARQLRREHGAAITLIALTGYGLEDDRRRAKEAGFDHHLLKPIDLDALSTLFTGSAPRA